MKEVLNGSCNKQDGSDQEDGQYLLENNNSDVSEGECQELCLKSGSLTACEWVENVGCFLHTREVSTAGASHLKVTCTTYKKCEGLSITL